jgi:hypothetical protein
MLATYEGTNDNLKAQINEFENALGLLTGARDVIKRKTISNIEARLIAIIQIASNGSLYDQRWLAASRIEIHGIFADFEAIRTTVGSPITDPIHHFHMQNLKAQFSNRDVIFDTAAVRSAAKKATGVSYGVKTSGAAAVTTGASGASFLAGPVVGAAVTGGTFILSFSTAAVVTLHKMSKAEVAASQNAENSLRGTFTY